MQTVLRTLYVLGFVFPLVSHAAGPLIPPAAPMPTMKTLEEIEPRILLKNLPVTITQPGSYYIDTNHVIAAGMNGITIATNDVAIDLNGFTITGGTGGFGIGVEVVSTITVPLRNAFIHNGTISGFWNAVKLRNAESCVISGIRCRTRSDGIYLVGDDVPCDANLIENCMVSSINATGGILLGAIGADGSCRGNRIRKCHISGGEGIFIKANNNSTSSGNQVEDVTINGNGRIQLVAHTGAKCNGNLVKNCTVNNASVGIYLSADVTSAEVMGNQFVECMISETQYGVQLICAQQGGGKVRGNRFTRCTVVNTNSHGFYIRSGSNAGQCNGNSFVDCSSIDAGGIGMYVESLNECSGNTFQNCRIENSTLQGLYFFCSGGEINGNVVDKVHVSNSGSSGIFFQGFTGTCEGNTIRNCTVRGAVDQGIGMSFCAKNVVEQNHVSGVTAGATSYGIRTITCADNVVIDNRCMGQNDNFQIDANDTFGFEYSASGAITSTVYGVNIGL